MKSFKSSLIQRFKSLNSVLQCTKYLEDLINIKLTAQHAQIGRFCLSFYFHEFFSYLKLITSQSDCWNDVRNNKDINLTPNKFGKNRQTAKTSRLDTLHFELNVYQIFYNFGRKNNRLIRQCNFKLFNVFQF